MRRAKKFLALGVAILSSAFLVQANVRSAEDPSVALSVDMSKGSGIYANAFSLSLSCKDASKIYYTTDGSDPRTSASRKTYSGGISIQDRAKEDNILTAVNPKEFYDAQARGDRETPYIPTNEEVDKGIVVKAVAQNANGTYGTVATNTYFVGTIADHIQGAKESAAAAGVPLSVVSISMDYADLFDEQKGIYINYSNKGKEWERNAHIDYFETDGETINCQLQQDCGIRIQGNYSRSDLMKGFRLYAREEYGSKNFKYGFFEDAKNAEGKTIEKYKKLVLRNGGNYAFSGTKYNDTYWQSLIAELDCETQSSRPCIVYLDGEYWGLYLLQQDYDASYFEETHGVDKDGVIVYKASDAEEDKAYGYQLDEGDLPEGETSVDYYYQELLAFFNSHKSLVKDEDYKEFCKLVDPQSVMDYFAVNVWVNNKWDWPGKNWSMWKCTTEDGTNAYADNRWRFCFYDLDFGGCGGRSETKVNTIKEDNYNTGIDDKGKYVNSEGLLGQNLKEAMNPALQCFILCMSNKSFREAYKNELVSLGETVFAEETAVGKLDWFKATYEPLFPQFYTRFFGAEKAEKKTAATYSGYAGYRYLKDFVKGRYKGIPEINTYLDEKYAKVTEEPETPDRDTTSKITVKVVAKKNSKNITIKTVKKGKVVVTLSKKIMLSGKKKVKKLTVNSIKNPSGTVKIKLASRLKKGTKVKVTVSKTGYKTTTVLQTVK